MSNLDRKKGKLYLIPSVISEDTQAAVIPLHITESIKGLRIFLAEDIRTARRFLSSLKLFSSIEELQFQVLNKDTKETQLKELMAPLHQGEDMGILSESGLPAIADPGALAVKYAHQFGIQVVPLVGPSSIFLALMASGLNGQRFVFQGYLPIDHKEAGVAIREFEQESRTKNQTQIFIETPYRNTAILDHLLKNLQTETRLCIAIDITGKNEMIRTQTVRHWRDNKPNLGKFPAVFLFQA